MWLLHLAYILYLAISSVSSVSVGCTNHKMRPDPNFKLFPRLPVSDFPLHAERARVRGFLLSER